MSSAYVLSYCVEHIGGEVSRPINYKPIAIAAMRVRMAQVFKAMNVKSQFERTRAVNAFFRSGSSRAWITYHKRNGEFVHVHINRVGPLKGEAFGFDVLPGNADDGPCAHISFEGDDAI